MPAVKYNTLCDYIWRIHDYSSETIWCINADWELKEPDYHLGNQVIPFVKERGYRDNVLHLIFTWNFFFAQNEVYSFLNQLKETSN